MTHVTRFWLCLPAVILVLLASNATTTKGVAGQAPAGAATAPRVNEQAMLTEYCVTCHNQRAKTAGLALDTMDLERVGDDTLHWEKVVRKIRTGMMPPANAKRPPRAVLDGLATQLEERLDRHAASNPNPGKPALHRLNRTEYHNAVRDLLGVEVDVAVLL